MPTPPLRHVDKLQFANGWYVKLSPCGHVRPISRSLRRRVEGNPHAQMRCRRCGEEES